MPVLGHGVDIIHVPRLARVLSEHREAFLERCFTEGERVYCMAAPKLAAQRLAARFAAKEAAYKCLAHDAGPAAGMTWLDFEVVKEAGGRPKLLVPGEAARLAADRGMDDWLLSLSHSEEYAIASVIAQDTL
ncbi:MAG: holo-ACP synthase [Phycisphaerales bacterium]|nr:holo-ACP synthase [Phycisphaerales bacterium]